MPCGTAGRLVRDVDIHCLEFVVQRDVDNERWELDPEQPRHDLGGKVTTLRHYHGLGRVRGRLEQLMQRHAFGPIGELAVPEDRRLDPDTLAD